jgi:2-haloacid dehalogenase
MKMKLMSDLHATECAGVEPQRLTLVATHPWDVHGAGRAGLTTGCVAPAKSFHSIMEQPNFIGETLANVVAELIDPRLISDRQ